MSFTCRVARMGDLDFLVSLLAEDVLGKKRERIATPLDPAYAAAMRDILAADYTRILMVAADGAAVGSLQLTFIPHLSYVGQKRAIIESVHVIEAMRGRGAGEALVRYAIEDAKSAGCGQIVLTSSKSRDAAHRFWRRLGFADTHIGFKLSIDGQAI